MIQKNKRKYKDNTSVEERQALINVSMWNRDPDNPRVIRVQDKGSRFVVDWKEAYIRKSVEHIEDNGTFVCDEVERSGNAMQHEAYIRNTKSFLLHLEHLSEMRAPFRIKLISWDIVNYYPNCNTQMCIEAVRRVLETAQSREFLDVPVECILEALKITMTSNNG